MYRLDILSYPRSFLPILIYYSRRFLLSLSIPFFLSLTDGPKPDLAVAVPVGFKVILGRRRSDFVSVG